MQDQQHSNSEFDPAFLESEVSGIESMCRQIFGKHYMYHMVPNDLMAAVCERSSKVVDWWEMRVRLGDPYAIHIWAEIKAEMAARAAARAIESIGNSV